MEIVTFFVSKFFNQSPSNYKAMGKTFLIKDQAVKIALAKPGITQIVFDKEGDIADYVFTKLYGAGAGDRCQVIDHETFRDNPFQDAAIDPLWFDWITRVFGEGRYYGDVGHGNLREGLKDANAYTWKEFNGWANRIPGV